MSASIGNPANARRSRELTPEDESRMFAGACLQWIAKKQACPDEIRGKTIQEVRAILEARGMMPRLIDSVTGTIRREMQIQQVTDERNAARGQLTDMTRDLDAERKSLAQVTADRDAFRAQITIADRALVTEREACAKACVERDEAFKRCAEHAERVVPQGTPAILAVETDVAVCAVQASASSDVKSDMNARIDPMIQVPTFGAYQSCCGYFMVHHHLDDGKIAEYMVHCAAPAMFANGYCLNCDKMHHVDDA